MKNTDLEKNKALKLMGDMKHSKTPVRFAQGAASPAVDRREQRRLDQAAGLVSFPVKLPQTLVDQLRERAQTNGEKVDDVVAALLATALKG